MKARSVPNGLQSPAARRGAALPDVPAIWRAMKRARAANEGDTISRQPLVAEIAETAGRALEPADNRQHWTNWSGSLRFAPRQVLEPDSEAELADHVRRAARSGRTVRVVGAGHSSSALVETDDTLISLTNLRGIEGHDATAHEATIRGGSVLHEAGRQLFTVGLAMPNLGDIDVQTVAGAMATGTHGTGHTLPNLAATLIGGRFISAAGEIVPFAIEDDPRLDRGVRVSLGSLGILTALRLRLVPAFRLRRREWCAYIDDCLNHLDALVASNRNFDFYWYPRSDEAKLRTLNPPGSGPDDLPFARCISDRVGWSHEVIARTRELRFDEMEYALPAAAGPACFREIRRRVKLRHRRTVGWRILYRTIAPDDAYLSPSGGRDTVTISLHQNASLPFWDYFNDIEPVFRAHGGRAHWGKKHTLTAAELRPLYPDWDRFLALRQQLDPDGVFLNPYLRSLFGLGEEQTGPTRTTSAMRWQ